MPRPRRPHATDRPLLHSALLSFRMKGFIAYCSLEPPVPSLAITPQVSRQAIRKMVALILLELWSETGYLSEGTLMQRIQTHPDPFEPFALSQAIAVGDWIFVSGQAALNRQGEIVGENNFLLQAETAFENLQAVLQAAGSGLQDVVKVTIFLTDMSHFNEVIKLRRRYFSPPYPADSIVEVQALALPQLMFEIEAIAMRGAGRN